VSRLLPEVVSIKISAWCPDSHDRQTVAAIDPAFTLESKTAAAKTGTGFPGMFVPSWF